MANDEHLQLIRQGADIWNAWTKTHHDVRADFSEADLRELDLRNGLLYGATFQGADLRRANLRGSDLRQCDLRGADLREADCQWVTFYEAVLSGANLDNAKLQGADFRKATLHQTLLRGAYLRDTNLRQADLHQADLTGANLTNAVLVQTILTQAKLSQCCVYGISAWKPTLDDAEQDNLVITPPDEATVTVDDLEIAQFVYLLLDNKKVRNAIDTITSRAVLILGRFTPERKAVLDALRSELREHGHLPILFDFDRPTSKNLSETVGTLASLARFVIADLTDPRSIPQELQRIVPLNPSLPVQPILLASQDPYSMFGDLLNYPWVLPPYRYATVEALLASLEREVIRPAVAATTKLQARRRAIEEEMKR
jgi:Pentapeptide repeats (8 copies)